MELVVKQPKDKPPFLGIVFESSYEASKLNAHLVEKHKYILFTIIIEISGSLTLRLASSGDLNFFYQYVNLKYDQEKLKSWLSRNERCNRYNFSHLYRKYDDLKVVETQKDRKLFVLKVERIMVIE